MQTTCRTDVITSTMYVHTAHTYHYYVLNTSIIGPGARQGQEKERKGKGLTTISKHKKKRAKVVIINRHGHHHHQQRPTPN